MLNNKLTVQVFCAFAFIFFACELPDFSYAQSANAGQAPLEIKGSFLGRWKDTHDPEHFVDIYKDGQMTIVERHTEVKDGSGRSRYPVTYSKGNRIMVDFGFGLTPLTISDDGTKISFLGNEYSKK